jgi:hypothetical protein
MRNHVDLFAFGFLRYSLAIIGTIMKRAILSSAAAAFIIFGVPHLCAQDPQDPPETPPPAPLIQPLPVKPPRHHLIELSAKNWHPLTPNEKFELFWRDMISWETHISLAGDAAISFATDDRAYLGTGFTGYAKRYGINVLDEANGVFFQSFLFPTLFHEEPRYIPFDGGTKRQRAVYALESVIIARKDSGGHTFNKSKVLGELVSSSVSYLYNSPSGPHQEFSTSLTNAAINLGTDAAFNLFKEFWPDFARKIKLNIWMSNIVRSWVRDVAID